MESDWSRYFRDQPSPPLEYDTNHHLLCSESNSNSAGLDDDSDPLCSIWTYAGQAQAKNCNSRSFAMDARIRLDSLKSGCNSPATPRARDGKLFNYNSQDDSWDSEESEEEEEEEESALDLVELLDVEDDARDEENWLYESPKKQQMVERTGSALGWCRHVLDNPSPETEAACRSLMNKLDQRSSSHFYRRAAAFHCAGDTAVGSSVDKTSVRTTHKVSDSADDYEQSTSDSVTTTYRLQDITDVHIMARLQEASLRQDYVSTPAAAASPSRRGPGARLMLPSHFNTAVENTDDFIPGNQTEASSSSCWQPGLSSLTSSSCQLPTSEAKRGFQIPKLARLHQQVTQFKLLKLAQTQATSPGRTRSPLRTSLRSLQAVRNSRSLETDECQPADSLITQPVSGASSVRKGSRCWSPLLSARDSSDRTSAVKRMQRSQSASPCRIPHPAKGYLSVHGRVFASPDRSTTVAWGRNVSSTRR